MKHNRKRRQQIDAECTIFSVLAFLSLSATAVVMAYTIIGIIRHIAVNP